MNVYDKRDRNKICNESNVVCILRLSHIDRVIILLKSMNNC